MADDGIPSDHLGNIMRMSADGYYIIAGAAECDIDINEGQGAAYVFIREGTTWTQQAKLIADDGEEGDRFGSAVSISGDGSYVIIGAYQDDIDINEDQGSAYIFTRSGTTWTQQAKLIANDGAYGDHFGSTSAISVDSNYVVIGALDYNNGEGAAYVFTRSGSIWSQQTKLTADDGEVGYSFGRAVAISADGDYVVIGSRDSGVVGAAYVFNRDGNIWSQQAKLVADDGAPSDNFSITLSISADGIYIVAGSQYATIGENSGQGAAYVFIRSSTEWTQQAKLVASDGTSSAFFCVATISGNGNIIAIGAPGDGGYIGAFYIFTRSGSLWTEDYKLTGSDTIPGDLFAYSISMSSNGNYIAASADNHNSGQGAIWVFS